MSKLTRKRLDVAVANFLADAIGEQEEMSALALALNRYVKTPCDVLVAGTPLSLLGFDFDGNILRGVTAKCRARDGRIYKLCAADVELPNTGPNTDCFAVYRHWMGLKPYPPSSRTPPTGSEGETKDFILLARATNNTWCCRAKGSSTLVPLRLANRASAAPGEIITVLLPRESGKPAKLLSNTIDASALSLEPLALTPFGTWDPKEEYWGDEPPCEKWVKAQQAWGPRPQYEMQQILPGNDLDVVDGDPILRAVDYANAGQLRLANAVLHELCLADLRCLDAHSHLGHFLFDRYPERAIRHYEVGVRIGELSLGENFIGLLPWGLIDNRPFLRCLMGYALCLWRLQRFEEAHREFERILWFNPTDNQGARLLIDDVEEHRPWRPDY
ncbi:MAG: tetratricopeptide repeat protein [Acidobacteria bacterium]|nr:tetratricopeptide repeat protein [Acidobacteriota bacterium]